MHVRPIDGVFIVYFRLTEKGSGRSFVKRYQRNNHRMYIASLPSYSPIYTGGHPYFSLIAPLAMGPWKDVDKVS